MGPTLFTSVVFWDVKPSQIMTNFHKTPFRPFYR